MGKLLADKLGKLANKPVVGDVDIEDDRVFEHRESGSDSDMDSGDEELKKAHYAQVGESKLRKQLDSEKNLQELDTKYVGSVGSREDIYGENASSGSNSGSDSGSNSELEDDESDAPANDLQSNDESESVESESEESDHESGSESDNGEVLRKIVEKETRQAMNRISDLTKRDASKGYSILSQNKFFENILDTRIKLQKAMNSANVLPVTKASWKLELKEDSENKKLLEENLSMVENLLNRVINFRIDIQAKEGISTDSKLETSKKRDITDLNESTDALDKDLKKYRTAVLQKWSAKVSSASGSSAMKSSKFKAVNQSADAQVENQLADTPRLIKRTCLNRRNVLPINFTEDMEQGRLTKFESTSNTGENNDEDENADIPKNYDPRRKDNNAIDISTNPYIFDDGDFYRVLLNDLIDKKTSSANLGVTSSATNSAIIVSKSNYKLKKNVDTKASKGRKLNYSIQEPIANYEAPVSSGYKWSDEQIDEFFAGLLGQKINFNEDSEQDSESDVGDEEEAIKNDDIQIFA
ncbi:Protein BFR2 [Nakaseomyces glabratus]|nr:Apoptosis-antagonizing transcription factor, C-terminal [Nakaseomyces glabratus]KAJ9570324.1 rRNA-processing protein bfr2 [Nakaseomyces glabratus]QNG14194.1 uncharacterized protein GWK60_H01199 [Nakaseomyces glabratus]SCV13893.1 Protein BFR2 [Nakaseomyces glabratus]SLM12257.1 Protein BFR2 [Nakaseomyces glabratus]